jgi:ribosomal protein S18 acetylase RimI-like enzyme
MREISIGRTVLAGQAPQGEPVEIRVAAPEDAGQIARILVDSWRIAYRHIFPAAFLEGLSYEERAGRLRQRLVQPAAEVFTLLAETEPGEAVGVVSGGPERDGIPGYAGEIYALYVAPGHYRRGIGRQLIAAGAASLAAQGCRALLLWVLEDNQRARAFYEALGGQMLSRKSDVIGETPVIEVAYGWPDLYTLL